MLLDIAPPLDIYVEYHVLTFVTLMLHLGFQCAIEAVGIYLLIFEKLTRFDTATKLVGSEEEIFHSIALRTSWGTACAGYTECHIQCRVLLHQPVDYRALSRPRRGREYYQFTFHHFVYRGFILHFIIAHSEPAP